MSEDFADRAANGTLPKDPTVDAKPVSAEAQKVDEDEKRLHYDDDMMRAAAIRATTVVPNYRIMTTGHYLVDDATGGLEKEFVWVIAADTSWGKSSHGILVLRENIDLGWLPLIVSWEDPEKLYADRILQSRARVNPFRFKWHRRGRLVLTSEEMGRINEVSKTERHKPMFLDARGRSVEWVAKKIRKIVKAEGVDIVMADYLQAADNEKPQNGRKNEVTYVSRTITDAIKTSGAAGIMYSQLTIKEGKATPDRHDTKESKDVGNAAETVALGFIAGKDGVKGKNGMIAQPGEKVLFVDKVKDGPPKRLYRMEWNEQLAFFEPVRRPIDAKQAAVDSIIDEMASGPPEYTMPDFSTPTKPWNERAER